MLGDYYEHKKSSCLQCSPAHRKEMVLLIESLSVKKKYKLETIYNAVNVADRYLRALSLRGKKAPSLVLIALTSLILSAKVNESN